MTNKTMPEQLFVQPYECEDRYMTCNASQIGSDDVEYVRADLVAGDANEPLEEGQFRWVSVGGERHVARLEEMLNDYSDLELFFCTTDGCSWPKEELDFIGPVIRPQEGE